MWRILFRWLFLFSGGEPSFFLSRTGWGTRSFGYNAYGERETDSLVVDGDTHLITELRDEFGRSMGYVYSKNGVTQQTVATGYGTDGRISSASFLHGGAAKVFGYEYLQGSNGCLRPILCQERAW